MGSSCRPGYIQAEIDLRLVAPEGNSVPVRATLRYQPADPYAVHVVFHAGIEDPAADVSWAFSRDLLAEGMLRPSGIGDVRVWPWEGSNVDSVALALSSPDGQALFEASRVIVEGFLERTYREVPLGTEPLHMDVEASLAGLLGASDGDSRRA